MARQELLDDTVVYDDEEFIQADIHEYENISIQRATRCMNDLRMFRVIEMSHRPKGFRPKVNGRLMTPRNCPSAKYEHGYQGYIALMRRAGEWSAIVHGLHVVSRVGKKNLVDELNGELLEFSGRTLFRKSLEAAAYFSPEEWLGHREKQAMQEGRDLSGQGFYGLNRRQQKLAERILQAIGDDLLMAYGYLRTQWIGEVPKYVNVWRKHRGLRPVHQVPKGTVPEWGEPPDEGEEETTG